MHILLAKTKKTLNELGLDKLVFVPSSVSPFKLDANITSMSIGKNMIELAIASDERLEMTRYEVDKQGISYIHMIRWTRLTAIYDARLYFVGFDSVVAIDSVIEERIF